jgi:putative redox protein
MEKHITVRWGNQALDFTGTSDDGAQVALGSADAPHTFRPAELVLTGLASCTGMDAISIMAKKRLQVESYEVEATGTQRDEHPKFFTHIVVEHIVKGTSIDDKAVARAIELSARKYCVVGANLASGDTDINHKLRIVDENGERTCDCLTIGPKGAGLSHYEDG